MAKNQHICSLLEETGELTEISTVAIKRFIAWEIKEKWRRRIYPKPKWQH